MSKICDECETVAHCTKHGCIPKVSAKDAMKLALEALEIGKRYARTLMMNQEPFDAAINALAEQPAPVQQEPIGKAYLCDRCSTPFNGEDECPKCGHGSATKKSVYAAPQPAQQEPVGVVSVEAHATHGWRVTAFELTKELPFGRHSLFASPAQRKPLSVEEIFEAIRPLYSSDKAAWLAVNHSKDEYRLIEAKHGIKENT